MLATLPFPLIMFPAGSYDIHPGHNKIACDNLFSGESNIWCSSVTTSVQHFTKRSSFWVIFDCFLLTKNKSNEPEKKKKIRNWIKNTKYTLIKKLVTA